MTEDPKALAELVLELNNEAYLISLNDDWWPFSYSEAGSGGQVIHFLGEVIWSSEDDERLIELPEGPYEEESMEDIETYVRRQANAFLESVRKFEF